MKQSQSEVNAETMRHVLTVRSLLMGFMEELNKRAMQHDNSKLEEPEASTFVIYTEKLKSLTYGSPEYAQCLAEMKPVLEHHYRNNSHHPEHYENDVTKMNLFDLIEMMADWKAATLRHADGDFKRSLEHNQKRFNIPEPLMQVLWNTFEKVNTIAEQQKLVASYPDHQKS